MVRSRPQKAEKCHLQSVCGLLNHGLVPPHRKPSSRTEAMGRAISTASLGLPQMLECRQFGPSLHCMRSEPGGSINQIWQLGERREIAVAEDRTLESIHLC